MADPSKTEKPTAKRRRDERKKGHVPISKDVTLIVGLLGMFLLLRMFLPSMVREARGYMVKIYAGIGYLDLENINRKMALDFALTFLKATFPLLVVSVVFPVLAVGTQTRFLFTTKEMGFKLKKLNPLQGIKKIFSFKNLVELLKSALKTAILVVFLYNILRTDFVQIRKTMDMDISVSSVYILNLIFQMVMQISLVFIVIAVFDLFYQRWSYEQSLKMTKQEVKEEFKQTEGNPEIKGKIRSLQRERAMSRMMQAVPKADVIIKNPTHFAVALKYDIDKDLAPFVIAKGQDELARRIIAVGEQNHVAVVENRPLARALYAACALNSQIPEEYYGAVAEILVYVFKMNKKWSGDIK